MGPNIYSLLQSSAMPPEYGNPYVPGGDDDFNNENIFLDPALFQNYDQIDQSVTDQQQQQQHQSQLQWNQATWQELHELPQGLQFSDPFQSQNLSNSAKQTQPEYFQGSGLGQQSARINELDTIHQGTGSSLWSSTPAQLQEQELLLQQSWSYQDVPLSEQQAPPDANTQFSVPLPVMPRPGEKPEFYDEVSCAP